MSPKSSSPRTGPSAEVVSDYQGFEFRRLWANRDRVTAVESAVLARALDGADFARVLEVGTAFGRLTPILARASDELVACDFDAGQLGAAQLPSARAGPAVRVAANVYHLPFADGTFSAATLVRVHHHLGDPVAALRELARVLRPGARLVVSYNPRPSLGTLAGDVDRALRSPSGRSSPSVTFARREVVALPPDPFPIFVGTRRAFRASAAAAGLRLDREFGTGIEEFRGLRALPTRTFVGAASSWGRLPGVPMRFAVLTRNEGTATALTPLQSSWACPRCRSPIARSLPDGPFSCGRCGFLGARTSSLDDLRYVPPEAAVAGGGPDA